LIVRLVWAQTPKNSVVDEAYYQAELPLVMQQLGRAGVRLAGLLNDAYAASICAPP